MLVTCLINVVVMVNFGTANVPMMTKTQVTGRVLNQSNINYIADFSIEADSKKYIGDYSKVLVKKDVCVEAMNANQ